MEESLEQLDLLLNGMKKGDVKAKEQEIAKLGKKYGIGEEPAKSTEAGGYGKKAQSLTTANMKAFDYQR